MDFPKLLSDPVGTINDLLAQLLTGMGLAAPAVRVIILVLGVLVLATTVLLLPLFLIWLERRLAARFQDRVGPNRVGPQGLLQTIADVLKLLTKEDITPAGADRFAYNLAPILSVVAVITMWAVVPFASNIYGTDINVGVLYIASVGSLGTLAIILAGWSSNNKYALLGAFRTVAQLVSYEIPMILALLVPVLLAAAAGVENPMSMNDIVKAQNVWFIVAAPLAALVFFATSVAEVGRTPFDLLEAESEIVAGFHVEYSAFKFAMFFAAEFLHAFTVGALTAVLFLGGWRGPGAEQFPLLGVLYFTLKSFAGYFVVVWIRVTLPRIRIDHMLDFNWKFLIPLMLAVIVVTAVLDKLIPAGTGPWAYAGWQFLGNVGIMLVTGWLLSAVARRMRQAAEAKAPEAQAEPAGHAETHHPAAAH